MAATTLMVALMTTKSRGGEADGYDGYGESRSSPRDYYRHHLAALSSALVFADTTTLLDKAASLGLGVVNDARASAPE